MNVNQVADEEGALVKNFINRYQRLFWIAIVAVVAIVAGTRYFQQQSSQRAARASEVYQEMLLADHSKDSKNLSAKGQLLKEEYGKTPYAAMGALLMAKTLVQEGEMDKAAQELRWVINQPNAQTIAYNLARLRLAAILQAQDKFDEALALVPTGVDNAFASLFAEARGDIYYAQNMMEQAKSAYLEAMYTLPQGMQAPLLQMKLVDLGVNKNA